MPSPMTRSTAGRSVSPLSSTSIEMPLDWTFIRARGSIEAPLAQPLGGDPLLALDDGRSTVQRARGRVRPVVAEEHAVAALGKDFEVHVRERRAAALRRFGEVHHQRADPLAAALEDGGRAGLLRVEVVVVRLVLGAGTVMQDLQAL